MLQAQHGTTVTFVLRDYKLCQHHMTSMGGAKMDTLWHFILPRTSGQKARGSHQVNDIRQSLPGWKSHVFSKLKCKSGEEPNVTKHVRK